MTEHDADRVFRRTPWWTSPAGINFGFLLPVLLLIAGVGDSSYTGLTIRGIHFLSSYYIALGCLVLVVTGLSGWLGSTLAFGAPIAGGRSAAGWQWAALTVGSVAALAYVIWFRDFFLNPMLLVRTMTGSYRPDRTNIQLTTGITSLANAAPVFFSIYFYKLLVQRSRLMPAMHAMCATLVAFTLFRVYAWSERLAMIEVIVPCTLAFSVQMARARGMFFRIVARFGPVVAVPALILYFAAFEYVRSWQYQTYNRHYDFWEFAIGRLVSYYYTSLNNGAGVLASTRWPTMKFENVLNWLHKAPFIGPVFSRAVGLDYGQLDAFLTKFGDPEFNNPSGVYAVYYDLGLQWGTLYFLGAGLLGGLMYRAYRGGQFIGVLFYPMFFIAFLEVFRYPYLGTSRAFTWTLGIGLALLTQLACSSRVHQRTLPRRAEHAVSR